MKLSLNIKPIPELNKFHNKKSNMFHKLELNMFHNTLLNTSNKKLLSIFLQNKSKKLKIKKIIFLKN